MIRIGVIGLGAIARAQHLPAIAASTRFSLAAIASPHAAKDQPVPVFRGHREMIEAMGGAIDAVAVCTPPAVRHGITADCLRAGLHALIEKPPAATLGEIEDLARIARETGRMLFTAWHSQHAPGVAAAAHALRGKRIASLAVDWREDVDRYHAGQDWIWQAGGFGVFDPGINAFSILTRIVDGPLFVARAEMLVPENKQAPIAASLGFKSPALDAEGGAELDWRADDDVWSIRLAAAGGPRVELHRGGSELVIDGAAQAIGDRGEYPALYDHFAGLIEAGRSDIDIDPLRLAADAFLIGRRVPAAPFSG